MWTDSGAWGITWWLILFAVLVVVTSRQKPQNTLSLWLLFSLLAFSALGKYLDSFGTGGGIRAGWGDSVNRSVFHAFAPAVAVSVLALYEAMHVVRKISGFFTRGRSPEIKPAGLSGS